MPKKKLIDPFPLINMFSKVDGIVVFNETRYQRLSKGEAETIFVTAGTDGQTWKALISSYDTGMRESFNMAAVAQGYLSLDELKSSIESELKIKEWLPVNQLSKSHQNLLKGTPDDCTIGIG